MFTLRYITCLHCRTFNDYTAVHYVLTLQYIHFYTAVHLMFTLQYIHIYTAVHYMF